MILPNVCNQALKSFYSSGEYGMDSYKLCLDKQHFLNYKNEIIYNFNSRGFRDQEWPETLSELSDAIWCVGDSFTVGVGTPLEHTWPYVLSNKCNLRSINIGMDGASNDWICRKTLEILDEVSPKYIVIQWSFIHRGELEDVSLTDYDRRVHLKFVNGIDAYRNFIKNIRIVNKHAKRTKIIHTLVPNALLPITSFDDIQSTWNNFAGIRWPAIAPKTHRDYDSLSEGVKLELKRLSNFNDRILEYIDLSELLDNNRDIMSSIVDYQQIDFSRDGFHYDIITTTNLVDKLLLLIR